MQKITARFFGRETATISTFLFCVGGRFVGFVVQCFATGQCHETHHQSLFGRAHAETDRLWGRTGTAVVGRGGRGVTYTTIAYFLTIALFDNFLTC